MKHRQMYTEAKYAAYASPELFLGELLNYFNDWLFGKN